MEAVDDKRSIEICTGVVKRTIIDLPTYKTFTLWIMIKDMFLSVQKLDYVY